MASRKERKQIWVHDDFKRLLKTKSAIEGVNMIDLTKAIQDIDIDPLKMRKKRR